MSDIPSLQELAQSCGELGSPPHVQKQIDQAMSAPDGLKPENLVRIFRQDPSSCFRLLRLSNSGLGDVSGEVSTILESLRVVGEAEIKNLLSSTQVIMWFRGIPHDLVSMQRFWSHSICTAIIAELLAEASGEEEEQLEAYYLAGLLHDIGRLILFWKMPSNAMRAMNNAKQHLTLLHETERNLLEYDHASIGKSLTKQWNLPKIIRDGVAFHHDPESAKKAPKAAAVVHIADVLANFMKIGSSGEIFLPKVNHAAWKMLDVTVADVDRIMDETRARYESKFAPLLEDG